MQMSDGNERSAVRWSRLSPRKGAERERERERERAKKEKKRANRMQIASTESTYANGMQSGPPWSSPVCKWGRVNGAPTRFPAAAAAAAASIKGWNDWPKRAEGEIGFDRIIVRIETKQQRQQQQRQQPPKKKKTETETIHKSFIIDRTAEPVR